MNIEVLWPKQLSNYPLMVQLSGFKKVFENKEIYIISFVPI